MDNIEAINARELKPVINGLFIRSANAFRKGITDIDYIVDGKDIGLNNIFEKNYRRTATIFNKKTFKALEQEDKSYLSFETKSPLDEFWRELNSWINVYSAQKVTQVQRTTKKQIASIIKKGMSESLSNVDIAKNIRKTGKIISPFRAKMIARTETHSAAVKAVDASVASTRVKFEREWASSKDERTRRPDKWNIWNHLGADGERTAQDGKFVKTGESLDHPGDPNGSAGNIINCRCVLLYHVIRSIRKNYLRN